MKLILEKTSVAKSIAAVLGASTRKDGYLQENNNEPLTSIQALSGHADTKSFLRYTHTSTNMQESTSWS